MTAVQVHAPAPRPSVDALLREHGDRIVTLWRDAEWAGDRELMSRCTRALNGHEAALAGVVSMITRAAQ